mgnify:CR=1 FL=1
MRIALVGAGGMGTCHYMNYQHIEHAQVVALVGRGENDRAHAEAWGLPLYDSVTEANRLEQIDLFDVCVPTYLHKAIVLEALACKKPVICEKPIALHLKDAQEMFDAAQANGVQLYVAQVLQFTREVEWLHRIVDERLYGEPLDACLDKSREQGFHLLRTGEEGRLGYARSIQQLEEALRSEEFGAHRMADTLCQQILIQVNRDFLRANTAPAETDSYHLDPKMEEILRYIAANLEGDLSVDALAARFYMSRYYLMHRFKEITGYTVHQYTVQKRLLRAGELIREGVPVMKAAEQAGFPEYSTFLRAFQNTFHTSPKNFR